jgi:methylase of polypeptide subunit release factors
VYQRLRAEGTEWNTPEKLAETLGLLLKYFDLDNMPRSGRLLEIGCGSVDLALGLADRGFETFGVDISPTAIN